MTLSTGTAPGGTRLCGDSMQFDASVPILGRLSAQEERNLEPATSRKQIPTSSPVYGVTA